MSNETMTAARALPNELDFEQWYVENAFDYERDPLGSDKCGLQRKAWHAAIARLRSEAAQGEQQAVAYHIQHPDGLVALRKRESVDKHMVEQAAADGIVIRPLVFADSPQPAAPAPMAGNAVDAIAIALWHRFAPDDRIEWEDETEKAIYRDAAQQVAALAQDRASQGAAAGVPDGAALIAKERSRQVSAEGWAAEHDDQYTNLALVRAAVAYALYGVTQRVVDDSFWPWHLDWWKPSDRVRNLVKAGALLAAEIDRLAREDAALKALAGSESACAPAAPPTGPILTGTMTGGAAETGDSVQGGGES